MRLTNYQGLPEPIIRAIQNDHYSKGDADYSCTELINPPRITLLKQRHEEEIVEDAVDNMWMLLGKFGHKLAEAQGADNALLEERLFAELGGRRISGASDIAQWAYVDGVITDYKYTSVWTSIYGDRIPEWEQQQNIYAWLFRQYTFVISKLQICAIYRDWRPSEALRTANYPPRAEIIPLKLWPFEQQEKFILHRVELMKSNEDFEDALLDHCTPAEMWEKPTKFAVMKKGRKSAVRVFDSEVSAQAMMAGAAGGDKLSIEVRPGRRVRCDEYCSVNKWCDQYANYMKEKENESTESGDQESSPGSA